jgi:alpha-L-rhamnosidase
MNCVERFAAPVVRPLSDANIRRRYEIEKACWIWHPDKPAGQIAVLRFVNEFTIEREVETVLHVSADQRYELSLDGEILSLGPDRSDIDHWSFASYRLTLAPGRHRIEAIVWWLGASAPTAQLSWRGGFILASEGNLAKQFNTGGDGWSVADITSWSFEQRPGEVGTAMVGHYQTIDGQRLFDVDAGFVKPAVVLGPLEDSEWSSARAGWKLHPSPLPDQIRREVRPGRILAVIDGGLGPEEPLRAEHLQHPQIAAWQDLLAGRRDGLEVQARRTVSVLWDLEDYYCGYSRATLSGGAGGEMSMTWAEALFERPASRWSKHKGSRKELFGKYYRGLRDTFCNDGGPDRAYTSCWWRAGRYVLLTIRTTEEPLAVKGFSIRETRYPMESETLFETDDPALAAIQPFCLRGLQMCAHETFMDCPHYEQLQYVGDTRLQALSMYALMRDARLGRRALELFDWSRWMHGYVNSSYPCGPQMISTFPLYWVLMVRDYAFWRDDMPTVREVMVGLRATLEQYMHLRREDGLLDTLPGWPFVDTVPEWIDTIYGPDVKKGPSSIVNLLYVYALQTAAELEEVLGEPELAARDRRLARQTADEVLRRFWVEGRGLLADDIDRTHFSQHAQCLALLTDALPIERQQACREGLVAPKDLSQTQPMYWMFYLFEAFHKMGRGELLLPHLRTWNDLIDTGLKTPPEMFEPTRSDCHGWGGHALFHLQATIAGIRPAAPGFAKVEIAPSPGHLPRIHSRLPHPKGFIEVELEFGAAACHGKVTLPEATSGVFRWREHKIELRPGHGEVSLGST